MNGRRNDNNKKRRKSVESVSEYNVEMARMLKKGENYTQSCVMKINNINMGFVK